MRGATAVLDRYVQFTFISIHAPHAGCDAGGGSFSLHLGISIHAPHAGCDSDCRITLTYNAISIHAPHAGCDAEGTDIPIAKLDFNPRTPCGVRPWASLPPRRRRCISIHAPHAGCDKFSFPMINAPTSFQSTHPMRGATQRQKAAPSTLINFNPRTPCGVRQMRRCGDD